jgi:hypothetical protein
VQELPSRVAFPRLSLLFFLLSCPFLPFPFFFPTLRLSLSYISTEIKPVASRSFDEREEKEKKLEKMPFDRLLRLIVQLPSSMRSVLMFCRRKKQPAILVRRPLLLIAPSILHFFPLPAHRLSSSLTLSSTPETLQHDVRRSPALSPVAAHPLLLDVALSTPPTSQDSTPPMTAVPDRPYTPQSPSPALPPSRH